MGLLKAGADPARPSSPFQTHVWEKLRQAEGLQTEITECWAVSILNPTDTASKSRQGPTFSLLLAFPQTAAASGSLGQHFSLSLVSKSPGLKQCSLQARCRKKGRLILGKVTGWAEGQSGGHLISHRLGPESQRQLQSCHCTWSRAERKGHLVLRNGCTPMHVHSDLHTTSTGACAWDSPVSTNGQSRLYSADSHHSPCRKC